MLRSPSASVWELLLSLLTLLNSDRITLALPKRLNRARTFSWNHSRVPIFRTLGRGNHGNWIWRMERTIRQKKNLRGNLAAAVDETRANICINLFVKSNYEDPGSYLLSNLIIISSFQASRLWINTVPRHASRQLLRSLSAKPTSMNSWKASNWWGALTQSHKGLD